MRSGFLAITTGLALAAAGQGQAQELYVGGGLAYSHGTSDAVSAGSGGSILSAPEVSLVFGQRFTPSANSSLFFGWEANADFSFGTGTAGTQTDAGCSSGATGSYLCAQDSTLRLVGVLGTTLPDSGIGLFGTLGIGTLRGDFSSSPFSVGSGSVSGWTAGIGVKHSMFNNMEMRGELIYDKFDNADQPSDFESQYTGTTIRVTVVRKF